jgi:hypothetical protein
LTLCKKVDKEERFMSKSAESTPVKDDGWENYFALPVPHCHHLPSHNIGEVVVKTNQLVNGRDDLITIVCEDQYQTRTSKKPSGHTYMITLKDPKTSQIAFRHFHEPRNLPSNRFSPHTMIIPLKPIQYKIDEGHYCSSTDFKSMSIP